MDIEGTAQKIAARLFVNGNGDHAERLVLELESGKDGGGWCEKAVADVIKDVLHDTVIKE